MGMFSALGTIGGSLFGGPVGGAVGGAVGGLIDGNQAGDAAQNAANTTAAATNQATQLQREMWQAQQAQQEPWRQAGVTALGKLQSASDYTPFGMTQFQQDPGYAFRLSEGQKALDNQAAARGGLISGNALRAATAYGQNMGSQEYTNAFNRYQTERQAKLGPLQSLAGIGQSATNTLGTSGQNYANNVGNALINQGYTQGNAYIAGQQATNSIYGNIGTALGRVTPDQWSSANSSISNYLNPTYSGQGPTGRAP